MSDLKWYWVYVPYLDPPDRQQESALKAGYNKVCFKYDADSEIRKAKCALWIHRAIVAKKIADSYKTMVKCHPFYGSNYHKWREVERKCRAKAEEYE